MCTVPTACSPVNPARTSRRNVQRFVRVMFALPTAGEYAVRIEERGPRSSNESWYFVQIIPSAWGFGVRWEKWTVSGGDGTAYEANVGDNDGPPCCSCKGFEAHGHCRHVEATRALLANGKLPVAA